jgi:hypothetical protein
MAVEVDNAASADGKLVSPSIVKGPWTVDEDRQLLELVKQYGAKRWSLISRYMNGRVGKQCRER